MATDEFLLNNSFGADELDMLIFPEDAKPDINVVDSSLVPPINTHSINGSSPFEIKPTSPMPFELCKPATEQHPPQFTSVNLGPNLGAIPPMAFDGLLEQWRINLAAAPPPAPTWMQPQIPVFPPVQQQRRMPPQSGMFYNGALIVV